MDALTDDGRHVPGRACSRDPALDFAAWMEAAQKAGEPEPTAMALSTLGADGAPRLRWVLCKGWGPEGLRFFTNLESDKGRELSVDGRVAAAFLWPSLHRQVRVEGTVQPVSADEADRYFASRERLSQIGAWASRQSRPLADRQDLLDAVAAAESRFDGIDVPRPAHWSGFRILARRWEFWQGRPGRLHERRVCAADGGAWRQWMLFP